MLGNKSYSRSLRSIKAANVRDINLTQLLRQRVTYSKDSKSTALLTDKNNQVNGFNPQKNNKNKTTMLRTFGKIKTEPNQMTQTSPLKNNDYRTKQFSLYLPKCSGSKEGNKFCSKNYQSRSKFQKGIDQLMNQVIKDQALPIVNKGSSFNSKKTHKNIRVLSQTQLPTHKNEELKINNRNIGGLLSTVMQFILHRQVEQQKLKKPKTSQKFGKQRLKINFERQNAKNAKQLLAYYPMCKIKEQQQIVTHNVMESREYMRHFREGKSSVKMLNLKKHQI